ncbi:hypothetical protein AB205_0107160, partial [Aquarana catesbeiana]
MCRTYDLCAEEGGKEVASVLNKAKLNHFKDPEFMAIFIDRYKEVRNLWEVKHSLYYNKQARRPTLEKLLEFVKTRVPDATIQFLEKKIGLLRNMYKKEHNKMQKSLRSGAAAGAQ